jgi:adenylate cyclase
MFFSDIAGFTTISEKLSPEELVWFLRVYLWEMSHIIMDNKWFINKYEWDAIMALWWVFWKVENYWIVDACRSALFQQAKLKELNEVWKQQWKDELSVRMWLHTWPAIIWNIGAQGRKMEFTALWDSVNLASRLEWVNKFYWTYICVSEDIYNEVKDIFTFRYLDKIRVKWKNIWINIYELVSNAWEAWIFKEKIIADFEDAVSLYMNRDFEKAKEIFDKLSKLWDEPSKVYKKRCEIFIKNPPENNWDGIWTMDEK